jgi:Fic family protein
MPAKWIPNFHREGLVRSVQATTALEGSPFSVTDVQRIAIGVDVDGPKNFRQMALNCLQFFDTLGAISPGEQISPDYVIKMHKMLTDGACEPAEASGKLRQKDIDIVAPSTREVIFKGVHYADVPRLLEDQLAWLEELEAEKVSPMIQAGIAHVQLLRIHPFAVANGLAARAMVPLVLFLRGFDSQRIFEIDSFFNANRPNYYDALKSAGGTPPNSTPWLEYFLDGMSLSIAEVKDRVINLTRQPARDTD